MNPSRLKFALVLRCNYDQLVSNNRAAGLHGEGMCHFNRHLVAAIDAIRRYGPEAEIATAKKALEEWQYIQAKGGGSDAILTACPATECRNIESTIRRFERYLGAFTERQFFELQARVN